MIIQSLRAKEGTRIEIATGVLTYGHAERMSTEYFYHADKGSKLVLLNKQYWFAVATYANKVDDRYIYSYAYAPEENWSAYNKDLTGPEDYRQETFVFENEVFFRVCLKRSDGLAITEHEAQHINEILQFTTQHKPYVPKIFFSKEIEETVEKVEQNATEDALVLAVLTDSHYTVNGTWEDTAYNIEAVHKQVGFDAIIHLGDITDGMVPVHITKKYANRVLQDLRKNQVPVYLALGNHDSNYFANNPEPLTFQEQSAFYLNRKSSYYYVDFEKEAVRCIFLASFDYREKVRYGFWEEELTWIQRVLKETPRDYSVLIFSHDAPLAQLDYWSQSIRNGEQLVKILEECNQKRENGILAFVHGHTHADLVFKGCSFPIVSIACNKCEYYPDKKPEGAFAPMRKMGTVTQDLWDTMIISSKKKEIQIVRFGAGEDRVIDCRKSIDVRFYTRDGSKKKEPDCITKVWAHRGASGYAPENTIPAFSMAVDMGADGIELDVQLTKDGQLVVIHDETIERVCNGRGKVADYTLKELKRFNFNKTHPEFAFTEIPTLEEVYHLLKNTDLTINVELKTGIYFYEGIEEKVVELTKEMGMEERIYYSSFNHASVIKIKSLDRNARTGFLFLDGFMDVVEYAKRYEVNALHPALHHLQYPGFIKECRKKQMPLHVWTVNDEDDMRFVCQEHVDVMITNFPDKAKNITKKICSFNDTYLDIL